MNGLCVSSVCQLLLGMLVGISSINGLVISVCYFRLVGIVNGGWISMVRLILLVFIKLSRLSEMFGMMCVW